MAKQTKRFKHGFLLGMIIYAVVFLTATFFGLRYFWDFIAAFEESRPLNTINAYMDQLTVDHICDSQTDLLKLAENELVSEETCRQLMRDAIQDEITYAKKSSESTDTKTVYVLRSGSRIIGSVTMIATEIDQYNFARWKISEEHFDLSFILGEKSYTVTVPEEFQVYVNGELLDESYITESGIKYTAVERLYKDYDLPTMVTYHATVPLGECVGVVKDSEGNEIVIDENTDYNAFLENCTDAELTELKTFSETFVDSYVLFTGNANDNAKGNYANLMQYVVVDSDLASRMKMALDGLSYAQSKGDKVVSNTINRAISLGDGRYICDITYEVDTTGRNGVVRTTNNVQIIVVRTDNGLKAESLSSY